MIALGIIAVASLKIGLIFGWTIPAAYLVNKSMTKENK